MGAAVSRTRQRMRVLPSAPFREDWRDPAVRVRWIRGIQSFSRVEGADLLELARFFTVQRFDEGSAIMEQGGLGDAFFLVVEGSVALIAFGPEGERVHLCTQSEGYYFGEMALVKDTPRVASVVACSPCVVLTLSRAEFKAWAARVAASEADVTPVHARTRLESIPFISQMAVKTEGIGGKEFRLLGALDLLGSLFELEEWPAQAVVFSEGDEVEKFYIIASGAVKFSARGDNGRPVVLNVLQRDSYFGEIALLQRTLRTATAETLEPCVLLSLTQERFKKFLLVVPELRDQIESMIRQRTATNLRSIRIFAKIEEDKRDLLGELLEFRMYRAGSMLMNEGAPAEGMDILIQGEMEVFAQPSGARPVILGTLRPTTVIGELALLTRTARTASVRATRDSVTLHLAASKFQKFLVVAPELRTVLEEIAESRRVRSLTRIPSAPIPALQPLKAPPPLHPAHRRRILALKRQVRALRKQVRGLGAEPVKVTAEQLNEELRLSQSGAAARRRDFRRVSSDDEGGGSGVAPAPGMPRRSMTHMGTPGSGVEGVGEERDGGPGGEPVLRPTLRYSEHDLYNADSSSDSSSGSSGDSSDVAGGTASRIQVPCAESFDGGAASGMSARAVDEGGDDAFPIKRTSQWEHGVSFDGAEAGASAGEGGSGGAGSGNSRGLGSQSGLSNGGVAVRRGEVEHSGAPSPLSPERRWRDAGETSSHSSGDSESRHRQTDTADGRAVEAPAT